MSVEALWTLQFQVQAGWTNNGIIVLESGRIFGGDGQYYYIGHYSVSPAAGGDEMRGRVRVVHYGGTPNTAFGDQAHRLDLEVNGKLATPDLIVGNVNRAGFGSLAFRMTKREELP